MVLSQRLSFKIRGEGGGLAVILERAMLQETELSIRLVRGSPKGCLSQKVACPKVLRVVGISLRYHTSLYREGCIAITREPPPGAQLTGGVVRVG